jgi:hypothetical protein
VCAVHSGDANTGSIGNEASTAAKVLYEVVQPLQPLLLGGEVAARRPW